MIPARARVPAAVLAALMALADPIGRAQQQPAPQRAPGAIAEGVTAVLVDVVVRDRRGQAVRDLTQADFEVMEDGVPQAIGSFTPIFDGAIVTARNTTPPTSAAAPTPSAGAAPPIDAGPAVTALVFDRLTPEARRLAVQAAQNYLGDKEQAPTYVGVFGIDLALTPYAPFTRNANTLRQALAKVESGASSTFNNAEMRQQRSNADQQAAMASQAAADAVAGAAGGGGSVGTATGDALLAQMQSQMVQDFDVMERDQQGYATTNGLVAIISRLRRLPGRKSLILFSEGIAIPPAVQRLFAGVIDAANRANVSIYTMDAAGLRATSEQAKIRDEVNQAARRGINTGYAGASGNAPLSQALEKNEDVLRQDPRTGLAGLAQDTGGLAFDNTNNLRQGFDRVEDDLRNYYLLGYTPSNDTFDGRFRAIQVRVKRPGLTVAARKGYFAVRDPGGAGVNPWEAPALVALEQRPVPNAFAMRAGALLFPERGRPGLVPVVVDLKTAPLTFEPTSDGESYSSDFTVLVRFLDQRNQVVRQVSQHYDVRGPVAEMERAKQGEVLFYREPELPAGVYSMEAVVHDALSGKSSVRFATVEMPAHEDGKLRMSSLVLVKRGDKIPETERRADNPLLVNSLVLTPNIGEPVSKASKELAFYFAAYPVEGKAAPVSELELLQNGKLLARVPMPLSSPDASGRIAQLGRLPLEQIAPGTYELRAVVKQGSEHVSRSTLVRIE
jgi:VWFA-related protein